VQRAGNTRFEFNLSGVWHLDKMPNWQHAPSQRITQAAGVGSGRFELGLVDEIHDGDARCGCFAGERIGTYVDKYQEVRTSGEMVIIDGLCASACTIVLGAIPHDKICVTSHAALGFHAAWDLDDDGHAITNPEATHMLYSMYPAQVKKWINQRGGLTAHMIYLRGKELTSMYHPCYLDARASTAH
jgi:hypothetical protein